LIADAFAPYVKTKNFHWHIAGSHYRDYHLRLDEQAASVLEAIDPLAERVRRIWFLYEVSTGGRNER
jgi:starvation-inducible DNA-binding protein